MRQWTHVAVAGAVAVVVTVTAGCRTIFVGRPGRGPHGRAVVRPGPPPHGPVIVTPGPPPPGVVIVRQPPPPLRAEIKPRRPSAHHVWLPGSWAWQGGRHVWVGGRWATPPRQGAAWAPGKWVQTPHGWQHVQGHWR